MEVEQEALPTDLIEDAFLARGVENTERKRQKNIYDLMEQLSLPSYRTFLRNKLKEELLSSKSSVDELNIELEYLSAQDTALTKAIEDIAGTGSSKDLLLELITAKQSNIKSLISKISDMIAKEMIKIEAIKAFAAQLDRLQEFAQEIETLDTKILGANSVDDLRRISSDLTKAHNNFDKFAQELAEIMIDSAIVTPPLFSDHTSLSALLFSGEAPERSLCCSMPETQATIAENKRTPNFNEWLPQLLPWPPPASSARAVISDKILRAQQIGTLGELADVLRGGLNEAGYVGPAFLGVPSGFAILTRIEQTDRAGAPLAGEAR